MMPPLANHADLPLNPALKLEYVETPSKKTAQKKGGAHSVTGYKHSCFSVLSLAANLIPFRCRRQTSNPFITLKW